MRRPARFSSILVTALMLHGPFVPALAQKAPDPAGDNKAPLPVRPTQAAPPAAPQAAPQDQAAPDSAVAEEELVPAADDPPIVVGRIARSTGTASLRLPDSEEWQPADQNTSLTAGSALWTEAGGRLALEVGLSRLYLEGDSAAQIEELDEDGMRASIAQGTGFLRLQGMGPDNGVVQVATPEAVLASVTDGRYLIEAAAQDGSRPGRITVYEGAAEVTPVGGEAISLGAGEALVLAPGAAPQRAQAGATTPLMAWALSLEPRRPLPATVQGMTGVADLAQYGSWSTSPEYGDVWYPPVEQGWQPYRDGSWQWRDPWGWVWVDAAPWGYAPAHYGRWVQIGPRWGWAPQPVRAAPYRLRPAWAPALVAFFGGVALGQATRPVGWVPLAPREPYYPWYRASPRYVQRLNYRQVTNVTVVRNVWVERGGRDFRWDDRRNAGQARFYDRGLDGFRHRQAAIQVPERVLLTGQRVRPEARRLGPQDFRRVELSGGLPLRPAPDTRGVTRHSGERLGFSPEQLRAAEARRGDRLPPPAVRAALEQDRRREEERRRPDLRRDGDRGPAMDRRDGDRRPEVDRRDGDRRPEVDRRDGDRRPEADRRDGDRRPEVDRRDGDRRPEADRRDGDRRPEADRRDAGPGPGPGAAQREGAREGPRREGQGPGPAVGRSEREALRERLQQQRQDQARQQEQQRQQQRPPQPGQALRPQDQGRQQQEQLRRQQDQGRQQQEQLRRQQGQGQQQEQMRRQQGQGQQQQEQLRRQQDQGRQQQEQMRRQQQQQEQGRQQQEQLRRQQDQGRQQQDQMRRQQQQQEQGRQQQEQLRRQQEQTRQQDQMRRQQQDQARRQQEQMQRQQQDQARRQQQDQARRQQEQMQRQQQDQMRRQQQDQARRQQEQMQRQQQDQARRQQQDQARRQQEQARRQQENQRRRDQ